MPAVQDGLLAEGGEALPVGGHQRGVSPGGTRGHIAPGKMIGDKVQSKCQVQKLSTEMIAKNVSNDLITVIIAMATCQPGCVLRLRRVLSGACLHSRVGEI